MVVGSEETQALEDSAVSSSPLVLLKNTVVFPRARVTINIGREKSIHAVKEAQGTDRRFIAASQRQADVENPGPSDAYEIATLVEIKHFEPQNDHTIQIVIEGVQRVRVLEWTEQEPYVRATYELLREQPGDQSDEEATVQVQNARAVANIARERFERYAQLSRRFSAEDSATVQDTIGAGRLADVLALLVVSDHAKQQELLETINPVDRLEKLCVTLGNEIEILELENKIRQRVRQQVDKNQREYYLKEQLRAIQEELGNDQASEIRELRAKVEEKGLPEEVLAKVNKEIDRLERMPQHSAEVVVLRNYLDWVLALPWSERTEDKLDMKFAQQVLDEDHYGLEKVKERIIEFLAVRQLKMLAAQREQPAGEAGVKADSAKADSAKADSAKTDGATQKSVANHNVNAHKGPILCLIGPPGVGKTSLGRSVARALGRKFIRISLGGVHDEAEIRGHRRTYVGALPGRIVQAMKTAGVRNPVFLLDEVDKMASDYRGDPSAALLEVLDPEQNNTFTDHYLELPYDLSEVFFICTGNNRFTIPGPLRDRMDIIELPGYTEEEKVAIGRNYVLPKVLEETGLSRTQLQVPQGVMQFIINRYTREAGVRSLERQLQAVSRKAARRIVEKPDARIRLTEKSVEQYLGVPRFSPDKTVERGQIGVATGLAWTANGGALLPVEVVTMPGKGGLMVTGQLGDVMQESARAALSFIRSRADQLDLPEDFPNNLDIHIHLPEGAIPKDGPSAGITMATAIISALTRRPVRNDLAMTGEITLRGRVLPIGGLKEKALAAHRVGIKNLIVPIENEKDLTEIPPKIRSDLNVTLAETMDQVLAIALLPRLEPAGEPEDGSMVASSSPAGSSSDTPRNERRKRQPDVQEVDDEEAELPPPPTDSSQQPGVGGA